MIPPSTLKPKSLKAAWTCPDCEQEFPAGTKVMWAAKTPDTPAEFVSCVPCFEAEPDTAPELKVAPVDGPEDLEQKRERLLAELHTAIHEDEFAEAEEDEGEEEELATPAIPMLAQATPPALDPFDPNPPAAFTRITLDRWQEAASQAVQGEFIVAAAAGSGKSTTLLERTERLVRQGLSPSRILILAYNRAAADSLSRKLKERLGPEAEKIAWTFHAWGLKVLGQLAREPWFTSGRTVGMSGPNGIGLALRAMKAADIEGSWESHLKVYGLLREALVEFTKDDAFDRVMSVMQRARLPGDAEFAEQAVLFGEAFEQIKREENCLDFSDMIAEVALRFRNDPAFGNAFNGIWDHVMVDEGQDVNAARLEIALQLGKRVKSLLIVGDVAQCVNGFTGSRPELFAGRVKAGATLLTMPVNRRSTQEIIRFTNWLIKDAPWRFGDLAQPRAEAPVGNAPILWHTADEHEEADAIAQQLALWRSRGLNLVGNDGNPRVGVLIRTNAQAAPLEGALSAAGLRVRTRGSEKGVWGGREATEVLSYLRVGSVEGVVAGYVDPQKQQRLQDALSKIANKPSRYVRKEIYDAAVGRAVLEGVPLVTVLEATRDRAAKVLAHDLRALQAMSWPDRVAQVRKYLTRALQKEADGADEVAEAVDGDGDRLETYEVLCGMVMDFGNIEVLEEHVARARGKHGTTEVEISTVHKAKGAEWDLVFVCGVRANTFPHKRALKANNLDEELRLFYVACSRPREVLVVSSGGSPSSYWHRVKEYLHVARDASPG